MKKEQNSTDRRRLLKQTKTIFIENWESHNVEKPPSKEKVETCWIIIRGTEKDHNEEAE